MKNLLISVFLVIFSAIFLILAIRGTSGNPEKSNLNDKKWVEGPFELSPERGRFALTFSLVEDESFEFDLPVARFATPDLGYINGKYVSLFAPGVSFLTIPGYRLGKLFGISQVGTFAVISLFASLNVVLIYSVAKKLGAKAKYSLLASLSFLFATPAFTYGVTLYQHHISAFLILSGIYVYLRFKGILSTWVLWFLVAVSIPVDFPNAFMMAPVAIAALARTFNLEDRLQTLEINFKPAYLLAILGTVFPILFFLWVNVESYGNPFQLSGTVTTVKSIDSQGLPHKDLLLEENNLNDFRSEDPPPDSGAMGFFNTRNISRGLYVHLISPDRGIIFYAPLVFLSFFGLSTLYKKRGREFSLLLAIALINLILYSMWGDPWGGWAFGSRYLIPLYAISSIFLAFGLERITRVKFWSAFFNLILVYSVFVNALGAITASTNPPRVEVLQLEELSGKEEKYTFERNWDFLRNNGSKSYFYQKYLSQALTPIQFYLLLSLLISCLLFGVFSYDFLGKKYFKKILVLDVLEARGLSKMWRSISTLFRGKTNEIWKN